MRVTVRDICPFGGHCTHVGQGEHHLVNRANVLDEMVTMPNHPIIWILPSPNRVGSFEYIRAYNIKVNGRYSFDINVDIRSESFSTNSYRLVVTKIDANGIHSTITTGEMATHGTLVANTGAIELFQGDRIIVDLQRIGTDPVNLFITGGTLSVYSAV